MSKEEIIGEIESAFKDVTLNGGVSLNQTRVIDDYGDVTSEAFSQLPLSEVADNWKGIPTTVWDEADCLSYLDPKGFQYYVPALMLRLLETYDSSSMMVIGTLRSLYPKAENHRFRYSELTRAQLKAIAHYLEALPSMVELYSEDIPVVERAFQNYWSRHL